MILFNIFLSKDIEFNLEFKVIFNWPEMVPLVDFAF